MSSDYTSFCLFTVIVVEGFTVMNRVLPVTIAIFRYILVCKAETAERFGKTKLARLLTLVNFLVPTLMVMGSIVCRDHVHYYTKCIGREEIYEFDLDHLENGAKTLWDKGVTLSLPIYHPFRILSFLVLLSYIVVIPAVYFAIYRFRKKHDDMITGKY